MNLMGQIKFDPLKILFDFFQKICYNIYVKLKNTYYPLVQEEINNKKGEKQNA